MDIDVPQSGPGLPSISVHHAAPVLTATPYGLPSYPATSQLLAQPSPGSAIFTNSNAFKPSPLANTLPSPDFPPTHAPTVSPPALDITTLADSERRKQFPGIQHWTKSNWNTAKLCAEEMDGTPASVDKCKLVAAKARGIYVDIEQSADMTAPLKWGNKSNKVSEYFKQHMYEAFPELQCCALDWKLHHIAHGTYPGWIGLRTKGPAAASSSTTSPSPAPPSLPAKLPLVAPRETECSPQKKEQPNTGDLPFVWKQPISQLTVSKPVLNAPPAASTARCLDMESQQTTTAFRQGDDGLAASKPPLFVCYLIPSMIAFTNSLLCLLTDKKCTVSRA